MKDLMFRYSLDAYTIQKGLHIGCVSLRFCYHKYPIKANATDAAMEQLTSCIRNNMYTFASMGEKYFQRGGITREQFRTGIREMEICMVEKKVVPPDGNIALAVLRWFRSTFFR
ncbi:uncharacterized protein LOC135375700 isoform X2 [Ornithodoros turicata]|uniref:uncharacterized protein LOC135375700 isoform X2 n=1 Tax=Ornithodoros turicata TaxID=34597 RepID=UPI00313A258E